MENFRIVDFCRERLELYEVIPTIPLGLLEVPHRRNPVRPALGQHFDPALIDPVEDAKLVREARIVGGVPAAKSKVFDEGSEIVLTLTSLTYCWSRQSPILNAHIMSTASAAAGRDSP